MQLRIVIAALLAVATSAWAPAPIMMAKKKAPAKEKKATPPRGRAPAGPAKSVNVPGSFGAGGNKFGGYYEQLFGGN
eukprot:CAMPEP_0205925464 /NCGR_PEP_ID=MMETSP1325-20131115/18275_1 /ASSEMBLY_ACC=CAM_ASM_000708 /TAXON_ID=236786 /ORGANISM="Florenciella sp., Strain RCC1007" /LENGTH=76 /DNA_ID=CAMNT_0053293995 /DNA_START=53 /DNA_END=283 /DNA_ORIENTATION=+